MPQSVRKSSIGTARRGPQKYIPYRADDYQHGKRTGIAVGYVDHNSDEFEPFEQVISQADARTPPKPRLQIKKKKPPKTPIIEEDDGYGEMSMELEESTPNSPAHFFSNRVTAGIMSSVQKVGSSSRPVRRSDDVDYNEIPTARGRLSSAFSHRSSFGNSLNNRSTVTPSRLSKSTVAAQESEDEPIYDNDGEYGDNLGGYDDAGPPTDDDASENEPMAPPSPLAPRSAARRTSFQQLAREESVEDDVDNEATPTRNNSRLSQPLSAKAKGKQKQPSVIPEDDFENGIQVEEEIERGLADVNDGPEGQEEAGMEEDREETPKPKGKTRRRDNDDSTEKPASKKAKTENEGAKKPRGRPRKDNVLREVVEDHNLDDDDSGLRRGQRKRYKPLEWWRLEKVVYGRRENGVSFVPTIKEIVRVPKEEPQPLGAKRKKRGKTRSQSRMSRSVTAEIEEPMVFNPEEGWDNTTAPDGVCINYETGQEEERRLAYTHRMLHLKAATNGDFLFQKVFGDNDFIAAGQLVIPPGSQKPTKGTKDNTFVFYVIEGCVNFKVHRTNFLLATGGMFLVPRGNMYFIQNISDRDAKLFFAQARKITANPTEEDADSQASETRGSTSRSPSTSRKPPSKSGSVKRSMSRI
ncbi:Mif2/CENP-C like-domain-containing protein [Abortiporus biennis]|nr:Mif2/CENP-C like-domain-containing protein [Abortiporus biennis]